SYFGTDQSQVQRYITAKSVDQARSSLLMSAYWKIPLQALVLLTGVLVFVFFVFQAPPLLFNPAAEQAVRAAEPAAYGMLDERYRTALQARATAAHAVAVARVRGDREASAASLEGFRAREADVGALRTEALGLVRRVTGTSAQDVNYVMPYFVLHFLPVGLIAGMAIVGAVNFGAPSISWLWHNVIGAVTVVAVGLGLSVRRASPR